MKESKAMMKKEVSFMKKKGAPKSMLKHEMSEMRGMKKMRMGGMAYSKEKVKQDSATKKYSGGGSTSSASSRADGIVSKGKTKGTMVKMRYGGTC